MISYEIRKVGTYELRDHFRCHDTVYRNFAWGGMRLLHEEGDESIGTKGAFRICRRRYGRGLDMESYHPGNGAVRGFWLGALFLLMLDSVIPHLHLNAEHAEGPNAKLKRTTMMVLAVTLHNIPEGMAVGVVLAGLAAGNALITSGGALALAIGIAIQNFPEGAIISMPLCAEGNGKGKAFLYGVLSGAVEPVGAVLTIVAASFIVPAMPYLLSFAAGAMMYVVVEELIPEMSEGEHSNIGVVMFVLGFTLMMALDVALG